MEKTDENEEETKIENKEKGDQIPDEESKEDQNKGQDGGLLQNDKMEEDETKGKDENPPKTEDRYLRCYLPINIYFPKKINSVVFRASYCG